MPRSIPAVSPLAGALALALGLPLLPAAALAAGGPSPAAAPEPVVQATELDAVHVEGQRVTAPQSPRYTQPLVDTPATVTIVSSELMQDQGVTTLRDALRNVPGISIQAGEGGVPAGDNLTLRGFSARTDLFVDGVRDIGGYARDPFNIEQIEVAKGPASAQTGRGSTGGSINLASKTARMDDFNRGSFSVGDNALLRGTSDFNRAIGDSAAFRVNLMTHENEVNGRDAVGSERWGVAPTVAFGLGTDTVTTLSLFHLEQDNVPDYGQPWVPAGNNVLEAYRNGPAPVDRGNFYGVLDRDYEETSSDLATLVVSHRLSDGASLRNLTRWGRSERDSIITAPRFLSDDSTDIRATAKTRDTEDTVLLNTTDVRVDFDTGAVGHALVAGVELVREESTNLARSATDGDLLDLYDPDHGMPYTGIVTRTPGSDAHAEADTVAVYVFDTLTLSPRWEVSGGLRHDHFSVDARRGHVDHGGVEAFSREDDVLSGRAGIVYKPAGHGSVYLGYGTSFNPSAEGLSLDADTAGLQPEKSRTLELGTKWELYGGDLLLSGAVFRTEKTNARTEDIDEVVVLQGEQRVDGLELSAVGRIGDAWTLFAAYTHLDGEVVASLDPSEVGNTLGNTPRHSASLWSSHAITDAIEVGFGVQHVGDRYSNTANTRRADGYTLYDAMVSWQATPALALRLNGTNLGDEAYIDQVGGGHYVPGAGRTIMLSADYAF